MDDAAFQKFNELIMSGRRNEAQKALRAFLGSFESADERDAWALEFLQNQQYFDHKWGTFGLQVFQTLFDEALWPLLIDGFHRNNADCLFWLAALNQNVRARRFYVDQVDVWDCDLLKRALALNANSIPIRRALLMTLLRDFRYAGHEWPRAILGGINAAGLDELNNLDDDIILAKSLDSNGQHAAELRDFQSKVDIYRQRMKSAD